MADETYTLVGDNQTPAEWTDVNDVTPDQKVLIGTIDEKSGNMKAEWRPSSQAAVFIEKTITENGVYDPQQENADGYSMVTVTTPTAVLGTKTVTANGTYAATDDNKDGYSEVTVNIAQVNNAKVSNTPASGFTLTKNIESVVIPEGVTTLGEEAFFKCSNLSDITLPSTLTSIGTNAFCQCSNLSDITLPSALRYIGEAAFRYCPITSMVVPEGVTSMGYAPFYECSALTSVTLPSTLTTISSDTLFYDCAALTTITIHQAEGALAGAPWGAPQDVQIIWDGE